MTSRYKLGLAALAAAILLAAALWVPINPGLTLTNPAYYKADLFRAFEPRALWGTVAGVLGLSPVGFIVLIHIFHAIFAGLLLWGLARPIHADEKPPSLLAVGLMGFLFLFNTPILISNIASGLVDIPTFTLTLTAALILFWRDETPSLAALGLSALVGMLSILGHEKSIFDVTILAAWLLWRHGWKRAAAWYGSVVLFYVLFISANANAKNAHNWTPTDYFNVLGDLGTYLLTNSFNIYGILLAAGFLWVVFFVAATRFWREGREKGARQGQFRLLLVAALFGLCLAPLALAWDTGRMVSLIWLPTFLLVRETGLLSGGSVQQIFKPGVLALLCLLQVAVPPAFALKMGAVPINCYGQAFYLMIAKVFQPDSSRPSPFTLRIGLQPAFTKGNVCWPPHVIR
jgi:hypothetical protein